jgi:hypothetical protein
MEVVRAKGFVQDWYIPALTDGLVFREMSAREVINLRNQSQIHDPTVDS